MGNVRYCSLKRLTSEAIVLRRRVDNTSLAAASGLMMKRQAFQFESEVRMLWIDRQSPRMAGRAIPFSPIDLIEQIMIGPTKAENQDRYDEAFGMLVTLGVNPSLIVPSGTYSPPRL
jgi:hypothetical protein